MKRFIVNTSVIIGQLLLSDLTIAQAAETCGLSKSTLHRILGSADRTIHARTAGRLARAFGGDVIKVIIDDGTKGDVAA